MIVDTSALVAILYEEPEAALFASMIFSAASCSISSGTLLELTMVVESQAGISAARDCTSFVRDSGIVILPFTANHAEVAQQAFRDYGKGRHPARLNFGDCFSYALAKAAGEQLLFKGNDFRRTDIVPAFEIAN